MVTMMGLDSKITAKGQTTIPAEIRDYLEIAPGDQIRYVKINGRVEIVPRNRPISDLFGRLAAFAIPGTTLDDYRAAIGAAVVADDDQTKSGKAEG